MTLNKNKKFIGVYDSGSNVTLLNYKVARALALENHREDQNFKTISGSKPIAGKLQILMKIKQIEKKMTVFLIEDENFQYDLLLGLDAIMNFRLKQDFDMKIYQNLEKNETKGNEKNPEILVNFNEGMPIEEFEAKLDHLSTEKKNKIKFLIDKYESTFAKNKFDVGKVKNHEANIKLIENKFIWKKPYHCSIPDQNEIEYQIKELLNVHLIEESSSPFAAPVTLALKREENKKTRLCIDFCELNRLVVPEPQPFPRIDDIIPKIKDCMWFSALDINSAFWSIPLREKDKYKTGFVTQDGHYQWRCLPYGLKTSPAIFQRILSNILRHNNLNKFCTVYIDDILIFFKTFEEHLLHLQQLFEAIHKEGFRLKFKKCNFARNSVRYLGHIIENNTIRPVQDNLIAIRDFPRPQSKKNIRQFLGKVNFHYKYIPNQNTVLEPFHRLLRKNIDFEWSNECEKSFHLIKNYLCSTPVLAIFNPDSAIIIQTDASIKGIGAVLKQPQKNGEIKPVAYFSKKLNETQKKKRAIYLECLAIKEAITYWQYWLIGKKFVVYSDHKPLENLKINSRTDEELGDLVLYLSQYDFEKKYTPGKKIKKPTVYHEIQS